MPSFGFSLLLFSVIFSLPETAITKISALSLHDALPICRPKILPRGSPAVVRADVDLAAVARAVDVITRCDGRDRKSTRLNSSHVKISYAVFCLKKKIRRANRYS